MSARKDVAARGAAALLAAAIILAPGVLAAQTSLYDKDAPRKGHLIRTVPFEKVREPNYCGPASLAMALNAWGGRPAFEQRAIAREVYDPTIEGTYGSDLVWYALQRGFQSYSFRGNVPVLKDFIRRDLPVIVLIKAAGDTAKGHFLVVVGFDDASGQIIFHDPYFGPRRAMTVRTFLRNWGLGRGEGRSRWMMAVVPRDRPFPYPYLTDDPMTPLNLAIAFFRRGDLERSRREWENARKVLGKDPYPAYGLAVVSLRQGRFTEAETFALEALGLDSKHVEARDALGLAYAAQGRFTEALGAFSQAMRLDPKAALVRGHYLKVLEHIRSGQAGPLIAAVPGRD